MHSSRQLWKVDGHPSLRKDPNNGSLIMTDRTAADDYLSRKKAIIEAQALQEKVVGMEQDITEIKSLLTKLLEIKENK